MPRLKAKRARRRGAVQVPRLVLRLPDGIAAKLNAHSMPLPPLALSRRPHSTVSVSSLDLVTGAVHPIVVGFAGDAGFEIQMSCPLAIDSSQDSLTAHYEQHTEVRLLSRWKGKPGKEKKPKDWPSTSAPLTNRTRSVDATSVGL